MLGPVIISEFPLLSRITSFFTTTSLSINGLYAFFRLSSCEFTMLCLLKPFLAQKFIFEKINSICEKFQSEFISSSAFSLITSEASFKILSISSLSLRLSIPISLLISTFSFGST